MTPAVRRQFHTARVRVPGRVQSLASTSDLFIPPGVTLDISAEMQTPVLLKRGPMPWQVALSLVGPVLYEFSFE